MCSLPIFGSAGSSVNSVNCLIALLLANLTIRPTLQDPVQLHCWGPTWPHLPGRLGCEADTVDAELHPRCKMQTEYLKGTAAALQKVLQVFCNPTHNP